MIIDTNSVQEQAREIPVRGKYDVIVAGGGLGGVCAAIGSARSGAKTLLIERNSFLGGVATAGMCCSIFNCYYTDNHRLGTTGIPVEIADALAEVEGFGKKWHNHKGHIIYDVERAKLVLLELVEKAGADILLNTLTAGAVVDGNILQGVIVESKSGREAVLGKAMVDATGDADLASAARVSLFVKEKENHSLCFRLGNVDVDAFINFFRKHPEQYPDYMDVNWTVKEALAQYDECGTFLFPHGGGKQMDTFKKAKADGALPSSVGIHDTTDACQMHAICRIGVVHVVTGFTHFNGLDIDLITHSINDGRRMAFIVADVYRKYIPGFESSFVVGTAANLGVRTSRYLDGDFVFTADMTQPGTRFDDVIARAVGWDDIKKHPGKEAWGMQACRSDTFDIPLRCILPRQIEGLIMGAGRSVSAENPGLLRVMVHTMAVGQGAGVTAAVSAHSNVMPRKVNIESVQKELRRQGVEI